MNMRHPVLLALLATLVLVMAGIYLFERQRAVAPTGTGTSWDSVSGYVEATEGAPVEEYGAELPDISSRPQSPETLVIPTGASTATAKIIDTPGDDAFDYNALLARLAHEPESTGPQQPTKTYEQLLGAFTFVPKQAPESKLRSPAQEALFAYGNEIGRRVQGFAAVNPNISQTVINQATNRDNRAYGDAVIELGNRYKALGQGILGYRDVPEVAQAVHIALGESYINLGTALSAVPAATEDQAFIAAITTYNNKADAFTLAFVNMVSLFSSQDVTFESTDPGAAFSFRHN